MFEKLFSFQLNSFVGQKVHQFTFLKDFSDWEIYFLNLTTPYTEESYSSAGVPAEFPCFVISLQSWESTNKLHKFDHYFLDFEQIVNSLSKSNLLPLLTHENKLTREIIKKIVEVKCEE